MSDPEAEASGSIKKPASAGLRGLRSRALVMKSVGA
jgi:hypothetical protein